MVKSFNIYTFILEGLNYQYTPHNILELKYKWHLLTFKIFIWMIMRIYEICKIIGSIFMTDSPSQHWLKGGQDQLILFWLTIKNYLKTYLESSGTKLYKQ